MQLQQFLFRDVKVRGPMGVFQETRVSPTGSGNISLKGKQYTADAHGWCEVPYDDAMDLRAMVFHRPEGGVVRFCTPDEIDENLRLGLSEQGSIKPPVRVAGLEGQPVKRGPGRPAKQQELEVADDGGRPDDALVGAGAED